MTTTLPLTMAERDLQRAVIDLALLRGWRCYHALPARTAKGWATPTQGHPGWPDLALARDGVFIGAELKTVHGAVTPEQRLWLTALGGNGRLWRPSDWDEIRETLR